MKRYILDSGIVSDLANRKHGVANKAAAVMKRGHRIGVGTPVVGELLAGILNSQSADKNLPRLERVFSQLAFWSYDETAAREYAKIAADLRRRGIAIQQIDMQTAAIAFALADCTVVTKDSGFGEIVGLKVEDWSKS